MSETRTLKVAAVALAALLPLPSCSGDGGGVEPGPARVAMTGSLAFPADTLVDLENVTIGMASSLVSADSSGTFDIVGNSGVPSMVIAFDQDTIPMLMGIVADPEEGGHMDVDLHSTALALAFLNPFVCVSDPSGAEEVMSLLEGLDEMEELEDILESRLAADPLALSVEDAETDSALSRVVAAYMSAYPSTVLKHYPSLGNARDVRRGSAGPGDVAGSAAGAVVYVDPSYEKSGHRVSYVSSGKFKVTNSLGRWAYCVTPTDSFYVFPNGTLLDAIRLNPFRTSEREFALDVIANEPPKKVMLYGFGMAPDADNVWDDLGPREQIRARYGGWSTFFFEFVPHVVSVISGVNKTVGNKEIAQHWAFKTMQLLSTDARMVDRTITYIRDGNMWGMAVFYTKWGIKKILSHDAVGETLIGALGLNLGPEALTVMAAQLNVAARVVVTSDAVASVIKTFIGFRNSRYKTTFEIWSETVGFGNIAGTVHDEDDATPLGGVRVVVQGDDGNPMDPSHEDVTSEAGAFYFENIMEGAKTLEISKAGYETKSVGVTVKSGKTVTVAVSLGKDTGRVEGKVINEILRRNGIEPNTFRGDCDLHVEEIGGSGQTFAYVVSDGRFAKDITPGTWRLIASHDLYWADTVQVTVESEETTQVPDMVLYPRGRMEGEISLDMDGNGTWEQRFTFTAFTTAAATTGAVKGRPGASATGSFLDVLGGTMGLGTPTYEYIQMQVDLGLVTGPGYYDLGGFGEVMSPAYSVPAGVYYLTNRERCYNPASGYRDMIFIVSSDPEAAPCNCGITSFGSLVIEEFGTDLTDVVSGGIYADLVGWTNCTCYCCEDVDGDGQEDDWVVDCAKARLSLDFEVIVGSLLSGEAADQMRSAGERRLEETASSPAR